MEKLQRGLLLSVIASEGIHVFCCVLPTVFSVLSLLAGFGLVASMPAFISDAHDVLHAYEVPMIFFSAAILVLGWGLYAYARQINCRTECACAHEPCTPKKDKAKTVMIFATILFVANVSVYTLFHRGSLSSFQVAQENMIVHDEHDHAHNHHH